MLARRGPFHAAFKFKDIGTSRWQLGQIYAGTLAYKTAAYIEQSVLRSTLTS
jgi:hypothetical protein